jgi:lysophospholipase L1-like esterase
MAAADASTIVAFGNSITDGARSTADADRDWPARLAARLAANEATRGVGVVNAGISGNRVLSDGSGVSVLARLDRDALSYPGVKWVIFMEGINDIGGLTRGRTNPVVTADRLIWAYLQVIDRAHAQGVKVAGATLTPYEGAGYFSEEGEAIRAAVNEWIRTSGAFDAVIDFDAATRDPSSPRRLLPAYDPGDHLHPNDAGYQAMADAIDLSIFAPSRSGEN